MNHRSKLALPKGCLWGALLSLPVWLLALYFILR